jgi:hypothetical protein
LAKIQGIVSPRSWWLRHTEKPLGVHNGFKGGGYEQEVAMQDGFSSPTPQGPPAEKKQKRVIITIWEGGFVEIRVPKIVLSRRQLFWAALIIATALTGINNLPQVIQWGNNMLALLR